MVNAVKGTIIECNTAYPGECDTTPKHLKLLENHGWNELFDVDLLDAEGPDMELDIPNGKRIHKNYVGKHMANYDSLLVLSHFKGSSHGRVRRSAESSCPLAALPPMARCTFTVRASPTSCGRPITTAS